MGDGGQQPESTPIGPLLGELIGRATAQSRPSRRPVLYPALAVIAVMLLAPQFVELTTAQTGGGSALLVLLSSLLGQRNAMPMRTVTELVDQMEVPIPPDVPTAPSMTDYDAASDRAEIERQL